MIRESIRGVELTVSAALRRSLAQTAYHVDQIVHPTKAMRGDAWNYLSIPPGKTVAYDVDPSLENPPQ